jgi:hypothetical protein
MGRLIVEQVEFKFFEKYFILIWGSFCWGDEPSRFFRLMINKLL